MPDTEESTGVEQPPFDPDELLRKLENLIESKVTAEPSSQNSTSSAKSWIWAIVIAVIVLIGITVFTWISFKNGRELAKLRHEKNKAKILADQAAAEAELAKLQSEIDAAQTRADAAAEDLRRAEADIRAEEARYEANRRAIDRMRGWDESYPRGG